MYDPLLSKSLPPGQPSADAYWQTTAETLTYPKLENDIHADVVIIGAGYTGLSCAIHLAKKGIKNVVVLDANHVGWGCSGRNAGFVLPGSGRLGYADLVSRFGKEATLNLHDDYMAAISLVKELSDEGRFDIDASESGYLKLAHSAKWFEKLKNTADYLHRDFDYEVEVIDKESFCQNFVDHTKVYGAIRYTNGYGINPLKLVNGYARYAESLGVKIFNHSSVTDITSGNQHKVQTEFGSVTADKLVMATNGYTPQGLKSKLSNKILPVLTSVIVTEPLTAKQLEESNFRTQQVMMDTRELKYYYRLLSGNRILFGGRGAISGKQALHPKYNQRLLTELHSSFPTLREIKIDHSWIGWISVSMDQMPHIFGTEDDVYYATGYCGSGVSFTSLAGKQLAELIVGDEVNSPLITDLPKFPFAAFRRVGQGMFYQYGRFKDWVG